MITVIYMTIMKKGTFSLTLSNSEIARKSWRKIFAQAVLWRNNPEADI